MHLENIMTCANYSSEQMFADLLATPENSPIAIYMEAVVANIQFYACKISEHDPSQCSELQQQLIQQLECIADTQQMEEGCIWVGDRRVEDKLKKLYP